MNITKQIAAERQNITIVGTSGRHHPTHCESCGATVQAFAPEKIAAAFRIGLAEVCRRVQVNQLHLTRTGRSAAMICGNSLHDAQLGCK